ncbi:MAG: epoxyqueuosine reductase QueH [Alphaproteobacteria bacterium]|nr:epoxyqueuosine reductase QueH [Alphaproteobacteria bacterium]
MSDLRLVLLSCCAPCSAGAIKQLADGNIPGVSDFIVLFYNPNIYPESEYTKRMAEQIKYCESLNVKYSVLEYNHDAWREAVRGFESAPERGARCSLCFEYRFRRAVKFARENGYNAIASVLGVSRHKDQSQVDHAAQKTLEEFQNSHPLSVAPTSPAKGGGNYCHDNNYHEKRYTVRALSQSKHLKQNMTDAERLLWYYLRGRKDFSFRKQAPIGNFIVDFLCIKQKLVIEIDGAQHGDFIHRTHDAQRDKVLSDMGYRILRFWNDEIFSNMDNVLNTIYMYLTDNKGPQSCDSRKCPPPLAGGGHLSESESGRGVAIQYLPVKWDEGLRIQINKESDFYRQNYCGCEFSIRKV